MEEHLYVGKESDITLTKSELESIKAEAYECGFQAGHEKIDKLNEKYEILKSLVDFISKALSL